MTEVAERVQESDVGEKAEKIKGMLRKGKDGWLMPTKGGGERNWSPERTV